MADNVAITPGTGETVGSDQRTIAGTAVQVQRVDEQGGTAIATGQVSPTSSAATLVAARDTRKYVDLVNQGSVDVWIGPATVTTANGFKLAIGASITVYTTALLQAITTGSTGTVHYMEVYDS